MRSRTLIGLVIGSVLATAMWPLKCTSPNWQAVQPPEPGFSFGKVIGRDGQPIWYVPILGYLLSPTSRDFHVVATPPDVHFELVGEKDLPDALKETGAAISRETMEKDRSVGHLRLFNVEETLTSLRNLDRSAGRLTLSFDTQPRIEFARTPVNSKIGEMTSWTNVDADLNVLQVTMSDIKHAVRITYLAPSHSMVIESVGGSREFYTISIDARELSSIRVKPEVDLKTAGSQASEGAGPGYCSCFCPGPSKEDDRQPWPLAGNMPDAMCGDEGSHCYRPDVAKLEGPTDDAKLLRVAIVASPRAMPLQEDQRYADSMGFMAKVFANSFRQQKIEMLPPEKLSEAEASVDTDQSIWKRTYDYYQSPDASRLEALGDDAEKVVLGLRKIKARLPADIVVYVVPQAYRLTENQIGGLGDHTCGQTSAIGREASHFFVVVAQSCFENTTVIAHEVGHLLAGRHEIYDDWAQPTAEHAYDWTVLEVPRTGIFLHMARAIYKRVSGAGIEDAPRAYSQGEVMTSADTLRIPYFSQTGASCDGVFIGRTHASQREGIQTSISTPVAPIGATPPVCQSLVNESKPRAVAPSSIYFEVGSSDPNAGRSKVNNQKTMESFVKTDPSEFLAILGFSDPQGSPSKNLSLAYDRVDSVRAHLQQILLRNAGPMPQTVICAYGEFNNEIEGEVSDSERLRLQRRVEIVRLTARAFETGGARL